MLSEREAVRCFGSPTSAGIPDEIGRFNMRRVALSRQIESKTMFMKLRHRPAPRLPDHLAALLAWCAMPARGRSSPVVPPLASSSILQPAQGNARLTMVGRQVPALIAWLLPGRRRDSATALALGDVDRWRSAGLAAGQPCLKQIGFYQALLT